MNRTIVCRECDNSRVIFEKTGQQLYIKCSKCGNVIMKTVHLESWSKDRTSTYKLRIGIEDARLIEADIIETECNKMEFQTLRKEETKIRLMYIKEYEYVRQLGDDEYREISNLNTRGSRKIRKSNEIEYKKMEEAVDCFEYEDSL